MRLGQALLSRYGLESLKARGVGGDTELGFIKGRLSHLTGEEDQRLKVADFMDMGRNRMSRRMTENQISREGVGTLNRETGLPQYHRPKEGQYHDDSQHTHANTLTETNTSTGEEYSVPDYSINLYTSAQAYTPENLQAQYEKQSEAGGYSGRMDYGQTAGMTDIQTAGYISSEFDLGQDYMKYLTPLEDKPFSFLETGFELKKGEIGQKFEEGLSSLIGGFETAQSKSGMAHSGTIQQQFEKQKKGLLGDYSLDMKKAQLGYATDVYGEEERQMERFYADIGTAVQMKNM